MISLLLPEPVTSFALEDPNHSLLNTPIRLEEFAERIQELLDIEYRLDEMLILDRQEAHAGFLPFHVNYTRNYLKGSITLGTVPVIRIEDRDSAPPHSISELDTNEALVAGILNLLQAGIMDYAILANIEFQNLTFVFLDEFCPIALKTELFQKKTVARPQAESALSYLIPRLQEHSSSLYTTLHDGSLRPFWQKPSSELVRPWLSVIRDRFPLRTDTRVSVLSFHQKMLTTDKTGYYEALSHLEITEHLLSPFEKKLNHAQR